MAIAGMHKRAKAGALAKRTRQNLGLGAGGLLAPGPMSTQPRGGQDLGVAALGTRRPISRELVRAFIPQESTELQRGAFSGKSPEQVAGERIRATVGAVRALQTKTGMSEEEAASSLRETATEIGKARRSLARLVERHDPNEFPMTPARAAGFLSSVTVNKRRLIDPEIARFVVSEQVNNPTIPGFSEKIEVRNTRTMSRRVRELF